MRKILSSPIFRAFLCAVLICALLVNVSPIKAKADAVSGALIVSATTVSVPVSAVVTAALLVLGIGYSTNSDFQRLVNEGIEALGSLVHNGKIDLIQTITTSGQISYYLTGDALEGLRAYLFDEGYVYNVPARESNSGYTLFNGDIIYPSCVYTALTGYYIKYDNYYLISIVCFIDGTDYTMNDSTIVNKCTLYEHNGHTYTYYSISQSVDASEVSGYAYLGDFTGLSNYQKNVRLINKGLEDFTAVTTDMELYLESVPSVCIDGTSARKWAPEYADRGLYVVPGSGTGGNEGQDGKWFWPVALGLTAGILGVMSQAEHWTAETPAEFSEYEEKEELTVTPAPEFDGYQAIEIAPVTNPNPDPDPGPGTGSDPDSGGDSAEQNWWQRFSQWFLDIRTAINELPNRFDEHFDNLNNNIEEVPSKFESWISDLKTAIVSIPDSLAEAAADIKASIQAVPNAIVEGIQSILPNQDPDPDGSGGNVSSDIGKFTLDLKQYFPFCIPFDLYAFFTCLNAEPVAPVIEWIIPLPGGQTYPFEIDLSVFDPVAQVLRRMQLLLFCVGLAFKTRDLIKG